MLPVFGCPYETLEPLLCSALEDVVGRNLHFYVKCSKGVGARPLSLVGWARQRRSQALPDAITTPSLEECPGTRCRERLPAGPQSAL